jgi:hypothetical protein
MSFLHAISVGAVLLHATQATIVPEYQSLLWKYEGSNFWAPLGLDVQTFAVESPAGAAPVALNKRGAGPGDMQYQGCTVMTLNGSICAAAIESKLELYKSMVDDVWSQEQVRLQSTFGITYLVLTFNSLASASWYGQGVTHLCTWMLLL